jgi:lipoyl(octanoyl) transferase
VRTRAASCATCASACRAGARAITNTAQLVNLGTVDYREALALQRSTAAGVADGSLPETVLLLEHPPTITLGRRSEDGEVHVPDGAEVEIVEVDRGGKSTYHAPGQLVCYPILDLTRHGQDVKRYCRDLEEALIRTMAAFDVAATRIEGLTGVWLASPPRKIASIGIHLTKWVSTHGYALNVDLDPAPFTDWITACGLDGYQFTSMARELGRPVSVDDVRPAAAQALADVFGFTFEELSAAA